VFDSGFDDSVNDRGGEDGVLDRVGLHTGRGGVLGYFRGNMTFVFLGLMWLTFGLQMLVLQVLPTVGVLGVRDAVLLHQALFVLDSDHVLRIWTWFTSVFAHGGFFHIVGNSFVIYFFGRTVERYLGTRDFTVLFLLSGALAGLGQIGLSAMLGGGGGVLGASGAGLAILGVMTVLNPSARVIMFIPVPVPVPVWVMTAGFAALSAFGVLAGGSVGGVAHAAHLIGLLIGLLWGKRVEGQVSPRDQIQVGGGLGPGGPGGPGRGRGPF
jgi:membrane associated rhomboid family serine protease